MKKTKLILISALLLGYSFNLKGKKIKYLPVRSSGASGILTNWDTTNRLGHYVEPGVYLAVIVANGKSISKRILFMN